MISLRLSLFRLVGAMSLIGVITGYEAQAGTTAARAEIDKSNRTFMAAVQRGDIATITGLYSADAAMYPPNAPKVAGIPQITEFWKTLLGRGIKRIEPNTTEFETHGDTSIEVGTYQAWGEGAEPIQIGKYVVIWKREKGVWKIHRDIFNTDPLPKQAAAASQ